MAKIQFSRVKDLTDLELYRTFNITRSVSRHIHRVFSLGVCEAGVDIYETKLGKHYVIPGSILIINVDTTHSSSVPSGYTYSSRSIRIDPELLSSLLLEISGREQDILDLQQPVIYNPALSQKIIDLHTLLADSASRLEKECLLLDTLAKLYIHYSRDIKPSIALGDERTPIARVCEYLQDCCNENVSLDQLAAIAGLSVFHLARVFTKEIGVPPHTYQMQVRLKKATDLIAAGKPLTETALETGFCDQSHFQKAFKKRFGISPGQYMW